MINVHLKIKAYKYEIYKDIYSISARDKINSIQIYETDFIMDRILNEMDLGEIWRFLLNMFALYWNEFSIVRSSEYYNWNVVNTFYFQSKPIVVSTHNIAISLPKRLRDKYFLIDMFSKKYSINPDLYIMQVRNGEA